MTSFGPIAPFYDRLMAEVPYEMWAGYYRLLLAQIGAAPEAMLDVCCGTGSVAELLTRDGFAVTGVDASAPMIVEARRKAHDKGLAIDYHVADVAKMDLGTKFDAAYSFFDSLNYIIEPEQLSLAMQRVSEHLRPGSSLVFDVNTAYAFEKRMFDQQDMRKSSELRYKWNGEYDPATRLIRVTMRFWCGGEEITEMHVQRAHTDEEIRAFLGEAGFEVANIYESYTLDRPRKSSDRLHYVVIKASG